MGVLWPQWLTHELADDAKEPSPGISACNSIVYSHPFTKSGWALWEYVSPIRSRDLHEFVLARMSNL